MQKVNKVVFGLCLIGLSSCIACSSDNKSSAAKSSENEQILDTLTYKMQSFKEISPYFAVPSEEQVDTTKFTAYYPVFDEEINTLVKESIYLDGEENMVQVSESFLTAFNEYAEDQIVAESGPLHAWFRDISCQVLLNTGKFLTLQNSISEYTGGAHGIQVVVLSNYDVQEKKELALTDIVSDTVKLKSIAEKFFREQENLSETESFGKAYFFDNDNFALADNFGLTKEGLLLYYNVYEIKPYADGPTSLLIPYAALSEVLTERVGLLAKNTSNIN
ncbi:Protein of unknown function [Sphingobacterium wenxiniae]|uniref:DUF3298 domain-containing protein n=2 Tax=Sphingobacterium wenxiniae TaxID=683125 RepID=A0A1I6QP94_9SPHI|nr:Protein of unknown function [Sphingobacterium wenxiniae]